MEVDWTLIALSAIAALLAISTMWLHHYAPNTIHESNYDICPRDCQTKGLGNWNGTISYHAGCLCNCQNGTTYGTCM